jgi:rhodanese-related sulfurtransferase
MMSDSTSGGAEPLYITEITPDELLVRINSGDDMLVVDMRQEWEYEAGHIPGAVSVFIQEIPGRMDEFPRDKDVIFQCWTGKTSLQASGFLIENGWDSSRIASLSGGIAGWVETHGPASLVKD